MAELRRLQTERYLRAGPNTTPEGLVSPKEVARTKLLTRRIEGLDRFEAILHQADAQVAAMVNQAKQIEPDRACPKEPDRTRTLPFSRRTVSYRSRGTLADVPHGDLARIGVAIDDELLRKFDKLIAKRGYTNRSEAFRDLIRNEFVQEVGIVERRDVRDGHAGIRPPRAPADGKTDRTAAPVSCGRTFIHARASRPRQLS
jgi:Arc/MetJ-type ribon-helix-helix transcriptional regulator